MKETNERDLRNLSLTNCTDTKRKSETLPVSKIKNATYIHKKRPVKNTYISLPLSPLTLYKSDASAPLLFSASPKYANSLVEAFNRNSV